MVDVSTLRRKPSVVTDFLKAYLSCRNFSGEGGEDFEILKTFDTYTQVKFKIIVMQTSTVMLIFPLFLNKILGGESFRSGQTG